MKTPSKLAILFVIIFVNIFTVARSQEYKLSLENRPLYKVEKAKGEILADGIMNEKDWSKSEVRSFNYTYLDEKPSDIQKTKFRMLWDEENVYLFFQCEDKFITARETERDGMPFLDDCAELFLIPAPESLNAHICFEINLNKAKNDIVYISDFYQGNGGVVKGYNPDYNIGVQIDGTVNDNKDEDKGWTMEFKIPIKAFQGFDRNFPIKNGTKWAFLALRQDRNDATGDRRVISTIFPVDNIGEKDVHQPNMFGLLEFVE